MEPVPSNPIGSLILIGILLFIVYRILISLNTRHKPPKIPDLGGDMAPAKVIQMPARQSATVPHPSRARLIQYTGSEDPFANDETALLSHQILIDKGGLERIGDFTIDEMPGYTLRAFTHPDQSMIGIIYKNPDDKSWVNFVTEYRDERVITTSSAERGMVSMERPHGMPLFNFPSLNADQLLRRHKLEIRNNPQATPIKPEEFPDFFDKNYSKVRAHLYKMEQEGTDSREDVIEEAPQLEPIVPDLPANDAAPGFNDDFVPTPGQQKQWLLMIYKAVPIPRNKRNEFQQSLVWIIDRASSDSIAETISAYSDVRIERVDQGRLVVKTDKGVEDIIAPGDLSGPDLFDKINSCLPEGLRFTRLPVDLDGVAFYTSGALDS